MAEAAGAADDGKTRSYAYVQCRALVASTGKKMDLNFLDDNERPCTETYKAHVDVCVFPWASKNLGDKW